MLKATLAVKNNVDISTNLKAGKCTVQVVGINQFPVSYVELPHPEGYTGHNFRK
ncbi:hypothetical protein BDFB_012934, partial [Asbolus verrucosus]